MRNGLWFFRVSTRFRRAAARHPERTFFLFEGREYTYRDTWHQAVRYAHRFRHVRRELGVPNAGALSIAVLLENSPEFLFAYFGAALDGDVLYAINTGFRGKTLAGVLAAADVQLALTDPTLQPALDEVVGDVPTLEPDRVGVLEPDGGTDAFLGPDGQSAVPPPTRVVNTDPFLVIYTSGTTGLPKGVVCSQLKLAGAGETVRRKIGLRASDRGYIAMPLFHSNAFFLGIMPVLSVGGSFVLRRRFSASAFERDILEHGCTYMNYVGQPIRYILAALEARHGDGASVERALAGHRDNKFRIAVGNGATARDRETLVRYLGMEHVYELYGSTEAAISTFNRPGDPIGSVGRARSRKIQILDESGRECAPGVADASGRLTNYEQAVGEICKKLGRQNVLFDGYHKNESATETKFRDGYFRSGDLGHIRIVDGKRYLYFNGRTDDWIRKDGENFSADSVRTHVQRCRQVRLAAAFGAPCAVSDERVMVALQLEEGEVFDPKRLYDDLVREQRTGGMDAKWMPDYVRIVDGFEMTATQKIVVRPLKAQHFDLDRQPDAEVYHRRRRDETFHRLTPEAFAELKRDFASAGRSELLGRY